MKQFIEVFAWKCMKCGRVLTTQRGGIRHQQKCKYAAPILDGQMSFDKLEVEKYEKK